jgi:hypothetical protein
MSTMFAVDQNNDLYIGENGNLAIVTGIEAVLQDCAHVAKAQLGEMVLAIDEGIPNMETVWRGSANIPQFEAYLRAALLSVDGVEEVSELETNVVNNVLSYAVTIQTIYGQGQLNG